MGPRRDDAWPNIPCSRNDAGPNGRFHGGARSSLRGRRTRGREDAWFARRCLEHRAVPVVGELGDLERQGVEDPFGLRTPAAQLGHGSLELVHPVVLLVTDALHAEGLEILEAAL